MSETAKYREFCAEPLGNKPVGNVPGVGLVAAEKLKSMGYIKATDLYNRLKELNFDENKFRDWMTQSCKIVKIQMIKKKSVINGRQCAMVAKRPVLRPEHQEIIYKRTVRYITGTERDDSSSVNEDINYN